MNGKSPKIPKHASSKPPAKCSHGAAFVRRRSGKSAKARGAHVGAVNYHFRDKKGLYAAVLEYSLALAVRRYPPDAGLREGATAEEKLRAFIRSFLMRILAEGFPAWHGKLIAQEIVDPTGAVDQMVDGSVRPLYKNLAEIIRELLHVGKPPDADESPTTYLCAMSVVGQCLHHYVARSIITLLRPEGFRYDSNRPHRRPHHEILPGRHSGAGGRFMNCPSFERNGKT